MQQTIQGMPRLERAIRESRDTDKVLVAWWVYFFILSWVTLGIYPLVMLYQRLDRRDKHCARIRDVFRAALDCTREVADVKGVDVRAALEDVERELEGAERTLLRPHGAGQWLAISIVTLGLGNIVPVYWHTRDWRLLQLFERDMLDKLSQVWVNLGITKYPVRMELTAPERNFWINLLLSGVTIGIYALVWDHAIHHDPEVVFKESARWEETLLNAFRTA